MTRKLFGLMFLGALVACSNARLGRLPKQVVELYDTGKPDGWMEIEADRDGRVIEIEADIEVSMVPMAVMEAARAKLPGGTVTGAEREIVEGESAYEVKMRKGGRDYEFVFTPDGMLVESEKEIRSSEAPPGLIEAAMAAVPGSRFRSVEIIERGEETSYHVKVTRGGATYKIVLSADGEVTRKVREARAEIEIPLE